MIQQLLLAGQLLVVGLVYLFVWRVVASARRDLGGRAASAVSQDSTIIPASEVAQARRKAGLGDPRLVVLESPALREGVPFEFGSGLTIGRASDNDVVLDDPFVSSNHLRFIPPETVVDLESTNGTTLNGHPLRGRARLNPGDVVQLGSTAFRFEVSR